MFGKYVEKKMGNKYLGRFRDKCDFVKKIISGENFPIVFKPLVF